jgi:hypothetical protein
VGQRLAVIIFLFNIGLLGDDRAVGLSKNKDIVVDIVLSS